MKLLLLAVAPAPLLAALPLYWTLCGENVFRSSRGAVEIGVAGAVLGLIVGGKECLDREFGVDSWPGVRAAGEVHERVRSGIGDIAA